MGFAVFVMSLKKKYVRRVRENRPDFPNLNIMVRDQDELEMALQKPDWEQSKALNLKYPRRFNRIMKEEGWECFEDHGKAYEFAYQKLEELRRQRRKAKVYGDQPQKEHCVYCIRLIPEVWSEDRFKKKNSHLDLADKDLKYIETYYTGQTSQSPKNRYEQHIDPNHKLKTKWGINYFVPDFGQAFELDKLNRFSKETSQNIEGLLHGESIIVEHQLAQWLRDKGYGAYCA